MARPGGPGLPRYAQLALMIQGRILRGLYRPGERLASENELAAAFGVSRTTVRQGLALLIDEGYVVARQGVGTFVADWLPLPPSRRPISAPLFTGYLDDLFEAGGRETERDLRVRVVKAPPRVAELLGIDEGTEVMRYVRTLLLDNRPIGYSEDHMPLDLAAKLPPEVVREHPSLLLAQVAVGLEPTDGLEWLEPTAARGEAARRLGVEEGAPLIECTGVSLDADGRPINAYRLLLRDGYPMQLRFTRVGDFPRPGRERPQTTKR